MRPLKSGGKQVDEAVRFLKLLTIDSKLTKTLCLYGLSWMLQRFANTLNCERDAAACGTEFQGSIFRNFLWVSKRSRVYPPAASQ